jgi:hypothetical protein
VDDISGFCKDATRNEQAGGLLPLLVSTCRSLCTDPRDRVYALLGIAVPYQGASLDINYHLSKEQVSLTTTKYIIQGPI